MYNFKVICVVIFLFGLHETRSAISDKRLCANENCTKPISLAKTILRYSSPDHRILSFAQNVDVTVYSKSAGSNMDLWGIEVNGKRGYAPKKFLRETKVFTKEFPHLLDTEINQKQVPLNDSDSKKVEKAEESIEADKVLEYVVDGTTIYDPPANLITPTVTENIKATATFESNGNIVSPEINADTSIRETEALNVDEGIKGDNTNLGDDTKVESTDDDGDDDIPMTAEEKLKDIEINNFLQSKSQIWINEKEKKDDTPAEEDVYDDDEEDDEEYIEAEDDESEEVELDDSETDHMKNQDGKQDLEEMENNDDMSKSEEMDADDSVKSRQLLSEKEPSDNVDIETEHEESEASSSEANERESIIKTDENISSETCTEENCSETESDKANTNDPEGVTESTISELEVPLPPDNEYDTTTPRPNEIDNDASHANVDNNLVDNKDSHESEANENIKNSDNLGKTDESENVEISENLNNEELSENNAENVDIVKENDLKTDNENLLDSLPEISEEENENSASTIVNIQNISTETDSTENKDEILSSAQLEINNEASEEEIVLSTIPKETESESNLENTSESSESLEVTPENLDISSENPDVIPDVTPENPAGILLGIHKNWFVNSNNENVKDINQQQQENQDSINENIAENEENVVISEEKNMIDEEKEAIPTEEVKSSHLEKDSITQENIELPKTEIISDNIGSDLAQEEITQDIPENLEQKVIEENEKNEQLETDEQPHILDYSLSKNAVEHGSCPADGDCPHDTSPIEKQLEMDEVASAAKVSEYDYSDFLSLFTVLAITGATVVIFMLGYISIDKNRREGSLIAKINTLEKALLVASKENDLLVDRVTEIQNETTYENDRISTEALENMQKAYQELLAIKAALEDQIQSLEKELENSTEVGLELNKMLTDILSSQNGSETLIANVEQLQRELIEQQGTINSINDTLNLKDTENHELQLELEIKNKKVTHLQTELDKMAMHLFKVEEDKEQMQGKLEGEIIELKDQFEKNKNSFNSARTKLLDEINALKTKYSEVQRNLELKTNEYTILKDNFNQIQAIKNNTEALESLLNASSMKAELQQLQTENNNFNEILRQEQQTKFTLEKQVEIALQEAQSYKAKYDESDKDKLEALTKLEVLSNYFKEKETQLQKDLSKQESLWLERQGEATSTVERIKYMQEELQNYKSQNESLNQEIVSQEVALKSQITVLEKKAHENWVTARQAERRLEDAKQEAAQLRNRLTLKERSFIEDKGPNRIQSPLEQNGDVGISPLHMAVESPASPPLLYGTRDHLTTSPPIPNMPPFLPPPPGVPFIPPPIPGVPGFMPPPPSMFSVDHRPPPLGRMSSPPPLNSRYSPDSRYSPYDRNSPSPPYDDDYGPSPPPMHRGYSPYNNRDDRREYKRPPPGRTNGRNKGAISSGSGNSNESLEKINRHHSKV